MIQSPHSFPPSNPTPTITAVVFDIGKVLIDFSHEAFWSFLVAHGAQFSSREEFIRETHLLEYERGEITTDDYLARVSSTLSTPSSREALRQAWKDIFSPFPEMLQIIDELRESCRQQECRVYLLSNSNALHWEHLEEHYNLISKADGAIASFEVGYMKPQSEIYVIAEQKFDLNPTQTLFFDDLEQNIRGAAERGWRAFLHEGSNQTRAHLAAHGVLR